MEECSRRPNKSIPCPGVENVTHVKDTDHRLDKFVGTWIGTFNGKQVELKLEKKEDFGNYDTKWEQLNGKIRIKDGQGNVIFESFNSSEEDAIPFGINFQGSAYEMLFSGINNCDEYGKLFIEIKGVSANVTK
ncbi:hypothetical protein [Chryseobacterium hispalense]|jgi:hypothetical protein|uniref:hypothetical protein n=1 Tax=Chryseobacterium hispalense TaxID=1453492 RepID=UPI00391C1E25